MPEKRSVVHTSSRDFKVLFYGIYGMSVNTQLINFDMFYMSLKKQFVIRG